MKIEERIDKVLSEGVVTTPSKNIEFIMKEFNVNMMKLKNWQKTLKPDEPRDLDILNKAENMITAVAGSLFKFAKKHGN
jgi:hypothetical protein